MGCGCSSGGGSGGTAQRTTYTTTNRVDEECDYTIDTINSWLTKVNCFKDKGLFTIYTQVTKKQLNLYIGVLLSAQNRPTNICYFRKELSEIEGFINLVINTGQC